MPTQSNNVYSSLATDQVIGPDHRRFKLIAPLGEHILGSVWSATDISHGEAPVSLFIIAPHLMADKAFQEAFKKQVIRARKLSHPHLLKTLGYFVHRAGLLLLATEPVDGLTLQTMLDKKQVKKLKPSQQRGLLSQIAASIDHFHAKTRLPHNALAPDQIFINRQGGVKVWPLSNRILLEETQTELTSPPTYQAFQSPEAFHPNVLPLSTDTYSLAVIAYTVIANKPPFTADQGEDSRLTAQWKALGGLSEPQWKALLSGLDNDSEQRPESSTELIKAIFEEPEKDSDHSENTPAQDNEPPVINNDEDDNTASDKSRRFSLSRLSLPRWAMAAGVFIAGFVLGVLISLLISMQQQEQLNNQLLAWKDQANIWKENADAQALVIDSLRQQLAAKQAAEAETESEIVEREPAESSANFAHFQDQLSSGEYGPEMVSLPSGQFLMGDQNKQGDDNELPVIQVSIPQAFALSSHEITFADYDRFATATNRKLPDDNGWGRGKQPVINVTWLDATAYTQWLSKETGQSYRLPTEAEWEYAARAGTNTPYWWGAELYVNRAVCDGCGTEWDGQKPAPVGSLPANPWGLADMNGNVDEWVQDCYLENYTNYPKNGSAYREPRCSFYSMRGGSWFDIGRVIRSASRYRHPAETSRNTWGFRVALDL